MAQEPVSRMGPVSLVPGRRHGGAQEYRRPASQKNLGPKGSAAERFGGEAPVGRLVDRPRRRFQNRIPTRAGQRLQAVVSGARFGRERVGPISKN